MRKICGLFVLLLLFSSVVYASEEKTFYMSGILRGARSSAKTLYLDQGEGRDVDLKWDKESLFCDSEGKKISSSLFISSFKGLEVEVECTERKKKIFIVKAEKLNREL